VHDADNDSGQSVEQVYERVRGAILSGELAAGVIVSQVQLAPQLGVSRTPLREALRMLQHEGLVVAERNRRVQIPSLNASDLEQIYLMRLSLEASALRVSIPQLTREDLAELEGHLSKMEYFALAEDYDRWEIPHRAFHKELVAGAGPRVVDSLTQLSQHADRYRRLFMDRRDKSWPRSQREHRAIFAAVERGDADEAISEMLTHLSNTPRLVIPILDPTFEPTRLQCLLDSMLGPVA
jgi:DNA-binding GntR family transcriptional regulator